MVSSKKKIQKVDGKNKLVNVKEERILVNTSTSALAQGVVAQLPRADQLSDPEIRPLLHLPRSTLVGLARVIANRSTIPADAAETPSTNWSVHHLVRYIAGRPLPEIETLTQTKPRTRAKESFRIASDGSAELVRVTRRLMR